MEIFKSNILKKEFEKFQKENLVEILKCGYCQKNFKFFCKFLVNCKYCSEAFCKPCHNFNVAKKTLIEGANSVGKNYIENFIKYFFCI